MSLPLYCITVHHALYFITDSCVSTVGEVGLNRKRNCSLTGALLVPERGQAFLSRVEGKGQGLQGLSAAAITKTEGFDVESLEDKGLA